MNYGLNYMGSKNTIARELVQYMLNRHIDSNLFIDATVGGGAMVHYVLREIPNIEVMINDLNPYFMDLYKMMVDSPEVVKEFAYSWCNRAYVNGILKDPSTEPDKWKVAVATTVWSFGGKGESYLYSSEIEQTKYDLFSAVMYNLWGDNLLEFKKTIPEYLLTNTGVDFINKRLEIVRLYGKYIGGQYHLENLNRAERLVTMCDDFYKNRRRIQTIANLDYYEFISNIPDKDKARSIIYIDPPYENTAEYMINDINYNDFWGIFVELSDVAPVYVSSYAAPEHINKVWESGKVVALASSKHRKTKMECLYYNGHKNVGESLIDLFN